MSGMFVKSILKSNTVKRYGLSFLIKFFYAYIRWYSFIVEEFHSHILQTATYALVSFITKSIFKII